MEPDVPTYPKIWRHMWMLPKSKQIMSAGWGAKTLSIHELEIHIFVNITFSSFSFTLLYDSDEFSLCPI